MRLQRIGIAADHGGYELKEFLAGKLRGGGYDVVDFGVEDDDLNMVCFGGLVVGQALAWELTQTFLAARFDGAERFRRRMAKVASLENKLLC